MQVPLYYNYYIMYLFENPLFVDAAILFWPKIIIYLSI